MPVWIPGGNLEVYFFLKRKKRLQKRENIHILGKMMSFLDALHHKGVCHKTLVMVKATKVFYNIGEHIRRAPFVGRQDRAVAGTATPA
jgi:hypothetical protein